MTDKIEIEIRMATALGALEGNLLRKGRRTVRDIWHTLRDMRHPTVELRLALCAGVARGFFFSRR
jgi:hypothetical protein